MSEAVTTLKRGITEVPGEERWPFKKELGPWAPLITAQKEFLEIQKEDMLRGLPGTKDSTVQIDNVLASVCMMVWPC